MITTIMKMYTSTVAVGEGSREQREETAWLKNFEAIRRNNSSGTPTRPSMRCGNMATDTDAIPSRKLEGVIDYLF
jgi:hypothetical protein